MSASSWCSKPGCGEPLSAFAHFAGGFPPTSSSTVTRRMPDNFFDTNVLLYLASGDPAKADWAEKLIGDGGTISVQVLNEIANVAHRKMGLSWAETHAFLSTVRALLPVRPVTIDIHEAGLLLAERYRLSIYDAMIAASALEADCDTLWSEDMQDGIDLDGRLRILDPFRAR